MEYYNKTQKKISPPTWSDEQQHLESHILKLIQVKFPEVVGDGQETQHHVLKPHLLGPLCRDVVGGGDRDLTRGVHRPGESTIYTQNVTNNDI